MGLDFSQKRLISAPMRNKKGNGRVSAKARKHAERLQIYAFLTGFLSTLISLVSVLVQAFRH